MHPQFMLAALQAARAALPNDKLGAFMEYADSEDLDNYQVQLDTGHYLYVDLTSNKLTVYEPDGKDILFKSEFTISINLTTK